MFSGAKAYTLSEIATIISDILNLDPPLKLKIVSADEYIASNDRDKDLLRKWVTTYPALIRGELAVVHPLLQGLLGREPKSFEDTLHETFAGEDGGVAAVNRYSGLRK